VLEREATTLLSEGIVTPPHLHWPASSSSSDPSGTDFVLFKNDRIFQHNIVRFNYTTYDVRRSQDVINPRTSHRNVMVLSTADDASSTHAHPFWYAQVLGIYHTNVVYTGPGAIDYSPRRLDFLWVRWYQNSDTSPTVQSWRAGMLDRIRFPPMANEDVFGFIDPEDVLRPCHVIPAFATGYVHSDRIGLSSCAKDSDDWVKYYVGR
jgi:hypothetical protein